jgi:DNA-binding phage protein
MSASSVTLRSPVSLPMPQASEKAVTQSSQKNAQLMVRRAHLCKADPERVTSFLRARYPTKTAEIVAADTGLQATTIRQWLDRGSAPSFRATLALIAAYGPALLAIAMGDEPPEWLSRAARAERQAELEARLADTAAELEQMRSQS